MLRKENNFTNKMRVNDSKFQFFILYKYAFMMLNISVQIFFKTLKILIALWQSISMTTWNVFHNENFTLYFRNTPSNWLELNRWKTSDQRPNFSSWIPALSLSCSIFSFPFPTGRTQGQTNILLVYKRGRTAIKFPSDFRFLVLDIFLFLSSAPTSTIVLFPFPTLPNKGFHFFFYHLTW